ncbi:unnamed protein product [Camellia sinensis]
MTLEKLGPLEWDKVVHGHEAWSLITCIWLHAGVIHLLANMLRLVFIGIRLEQQFGFVQLRAIYLLSGFGESILSALFIQHRISGGAFGALFGLLGVATLFTLMIIIVINLAVGILPYVDNFANSGGFFTADALRVGAIYLLSGFGGSILSALFIQRSISVGASGALFGLLGAMLSELLTNWTIYTNKAAALFTLLIIIVINLAVGILPHVDNFAHLGGFLTGFLLGFLLLLRPQFGWPEHQHLQADARVKSKHTIYQYVFLVVALVLLIAGIYGGTGNAFQRGEWKQSLQLVPLPQLCAYLKMELQ